MRWILIALTVVAVGAGAWLTVDLVPPVSHQDAPVQEEPPGEDASPAAQMLPPPTSPGPMVPATPRSAPDQSPAEARDVPPDPELQRMVDRWRAEDEAAEARDQGDPVDSGGPSDWALGQLERVESQRDAHLRRLWDAGEYHARQVEAARQADSEGRRAAAEANARSISRQVKPLRATILRLHERALRHRDRLDLPAQGLPRPHPDLVGEPPRDYFDLGDRLP